MSRQLYRRVSGKSPLGELQSPLEEHIWRVSRQFYRSVSSTSPLGELPELRIWNY